MNSTVRTADALITALRDFIALLNLESAALAGNDAEALAGHAARKQQLAQALAAQWQALLMALDLKPEASLSNLRDSGLPAEVAETVQRLSKEADRINQINGKMIEEQIRRTQAAMNFLQRASAAHALYGADGLMVGTGKRNRSIDQA
jgi:flagellar biosynthesis/type III secretory pathway chaperone